MQPSYDEIAGRSVERLTALTDGVFAVAMTLLVFDLRAPAVGAIHNEHDLLRCLLALLPQLAVYVLSFMTLGIFWLRQQTLLNYLASSDRELAWLNLGFLLAVSVMPFSTSLMAEFIAYRVALLVYWANILVLGMILYLSWSHACRASLMRDDVPIETRRWVERRILIAQVLYAAGAALCAASTYASLAVIMLVQLNYVVAPRVPGLSRL